MTKRIVLGMKTGTTPEQRNSQQDQPEKRTNFEMVAVGVCPHDNAKLGDEVHGHGVGVTRICETYGHIWYINKKIRACKCLTCHGSARKSMEQTIPNRAVQNSAKNNGGPSWSRTRDLSLIRTAL